jgi:hypothetical protein
MFKDVIKSLMRSSAWHTLLILTVTREGLMGFMALTLLVMGVPEKTILLGFFLLFFGNIIFLNLVGHLQTRYKLLIVQVLTALGSVSIVIFALVEQKIAPYFFFLGVFLIVSVKEIYFAESISSLQVNAERLRLSLSTVVAASTVVTGVLLSVTMPIFGLAISSSVNNLVYLTLFLSILTLINVQQGIKVIDRRVFTLPKIDFSLSREVKRMLLLVFLANAISIFGSRFLIPILVLAVTEEFGMTQDSFKYLGLLISFAVLLTLIGNSLRKTGVNDRDLMNFGYFAALLAWLIISGAMFFMSLDEASMGVFAIVSLVAMVFKEMSNKFWNAGFYGRLKQCISLTCKDSDIQSQIYKQIVERVILLANIGGAVIFGIMIISYGYVDTYAVVFIFSFVSMILGFISMYLEKDVRRDSLYVV